MKRKHAHRPVAKKTRHFCKCHKEPLSDFIIPDSWEITDEFTPYKTGASETVDLSDVAVFEEPQRERVYSESAVRDLKTQLVEVQEQLDTANKKIVQLLKLLSSI